jgi:hypothetical protein
MVSHWAVNYCTCPCSRDITRRDVSRYANMHFALELANGRCRVVAPFPLRNVSLWAYEPWDGTHGWLQQCTSLWLETPGISTPEIQAGSTLWEGDCRRCILLSLCPGSNTDQDTFDINGRACWWCYASVLKINWKNARNGGVAGLTWIVSWSCLATCIHTLSEGLAWHSV